MPPDGPICIAPTKQQFAAAMLEYLPHPGYEDGTPVVMGAKGDYFVDDKGQIHQLDRPMVDCSGSVTFKFRKLSGIDLRNIENAQHLHDECPELLEEGKQEPGDLIFYGFNDRIVTHVTVVLAGGRMISADGARSDRRTPAELVRVLTDPSSRVRLYDKVPHQWDANEYFLGYRRNVLFDADFLKKHATPSKEL